MRNGNKLFLDPDILIRIDFSHLDLESGGKNDPQKKGGKVMKFMF
jgi:hypothetical protein